MIDYKLYKTIEILELTVDSLSEEVHTLRQQQQSLLDQIKILKERIINDDCK